MRKFATIVSVLTCLLIFSLEKPLFAVTTPLIAPRMQRISTAGKPETTAALASDLGNSTLVATTIGLFHDPQFIDNGPLAGNSLGAPAFGLTTSDRPIFTDTSEVRRTLETALAVGQTFSADVDGSMLDPMAIGFTTGNTFDLYGSDNKERFSLFTNNQYHNDHWTATGDADTGIPAGNSFHFDFTLVTANTYDLVLLPLGGGPPLFTQTGAPLVGTTDVGIDTIRISAYGTGSSADGSKEIFFNNLTVTGLAGDYNRDGVVDAADYVVWRIGLGTTYTQNDYNVWRTNFQQTAGSGSVASTNAAVPEPTTLVLLMFAAAGWCKSEVTRFVGATRRDFSRSLSRDCR